MKDGQPETGASPGGEEGVWAQPGGSTRGKVSLEGRPGRLSLDSNT